MTATTFGLTNKVISRVGLGTYGHGEAYGGITREESLAILHSVAEYATKNANLIIDTAPRYGNGLVEKWIGEFLRECKNDNILIATKGGRHIENGRINEKDFSAEFLKNDLERSLKRLGVDSVFLYQLHNPSDDTITDGSVFAVLETMRKQGKIQWYGVSIDTAEEGLAVLEICRKNGNKGLASLQLIYNVFQKQGWEDLFCEAKSVGVSIIAREPLCRGFLSDLYIKGIPRELSDAPAKTVELYGSEQIMARVRELRNLLSSRDIGIALAQASLSFILANPSITTVIPGINQKAYIEGDLSVSETDINQETVELIKQLPDLLPLQS